MEHELISSADAVPARTLPEPTTPAADAGAGTNVGDLERWISSIGGGALTMLGMRRGGLLGTALALTGGSLIWRGVSGQCPAYQALDINTASSSASSPASQSGQSSASNAPKNFDVRQRVTINKSAEELYTFWRNFENLPQFMRHLESVTTLDTTRSHWVAKAPAGTTVAWDAEIITDQPNQEIAWRSAADADVPNSGSVRFVPSTAGRGTEVHVTIGYNPPAGVLGAAVAKLFGEEPNQQVGEDLLHFKQLMETGEVATTEGQPHGQRSALGKILSPKN